MTVVIGGGTAGLAIASRLAQVASVAVIEAGGFYEQDNGNLSTVPGYATAMPFLDTTPSYPRNSLMDWDYVSVPQKAAGGRQIHYAQGKTLGGSSAINTLAFHRATYGAYQKWADVVGDPSYTYWNILPFFKRSAFSYPPNFPKRNTPNATFIYDPTAFSDSLKGPVQVSWAQWVDPTITWLAKGIRSLGLPQSVLGLNSGLLTGTSAYVTTSVDPCDATRSSSRTSYMEQIGVPAGLQVYHHTRATRILFSSKRAKGVQVTANEKSYILTAKREVILSAGVFGSPHLLLVSGIGPAATLSKYNIPVISNLAGVGQNLWDQLYFQIINVVSTPSGGQEIALDPEKANKQYYEQQWGPLSSISAYISFEKIPSTLRKTFSSATKVALDWFPADWPEVEYVAGAAAGPNGSTLGVLSACLTAPLSRGSVTIQSADSAIPPVIDLGWFTNPADGEVAVAGLKRARQAFNGISSIKVGPEVAPGDAVKTDAQILAFVKNAATQIWHAGATCSMGKKGDKNAVVDSKAKVFGVDGLRVVDASAFPFMVPGHPQSTVYMLAEKIADAIIKRK
ncbi:alcohol oxidase [Lophium mytilinum]|uniref:Alcohol oxidase n=1 Tax=Lophium mytilinum TaxID=390894 RepID=A0A6A6RAV7_9PEZI|nr:alcohol oxidase [Lophium mytilinum]